MTFPSRKLYVEQKAVITAKSEWQLTYTEQSIVGTFTGFLVLFSSVQIHS